MELPFSISYRMPYNLQFSKPSLDLFQISPSREPLTLPPPLPGSSPSAPPFSIPEDLYNNALDVKIPIIFAVVYVVSISIPNAYNSNRGNKPWAISKTRIFSTFVVLHNIFLAVYSGWTFLGMWGALSRSVPSPYGPDGFIGTVDSLCKIHGSRGLGHDVIFNSTLSSWVSRSTSMTPNEMKSPDLYTDGRIWNEGLAFYGWIFYISKFYELLDTFIIVAKGKRSATLQTYHHSGAMLCMWSGIRYMSPPIWMFVLVNSAIHTLMFLVGSAYAAVHSFITYNVPVEVSLIETITENMDPLPVNQMGVADKLKNLLLTSLGRPNAASPRSPVTQSIQQIGSRTEHQTISCIDNSGQTFAIWLNIIYLTPLTYLFVRFFIKAYLPQSKKIGDKNHGDEAKQNNYPNSSATGSRKKE